MDPETLKLLCELRDRLAVTLAWPENNELRSRLRVAIMRAEDEAKRQAEAKP